MNVPNVPRRVERVRYDIRYRSVRVAHIESRSPNFISITFAGAALEDFVSASFDDHVKLIFEGADGEPILRDYTPRRFDAERCELAIEFALHGDGRACNWARQARVGETLTIAGPRGSMIIPTDYDWHLLIGDATALPAIDRRLQELPHGSRAQVLVQLGNMADRRELVGGAHVDSLWLSGENELIAALRSIHVPPGEGFAWAAGEASVMKRVRAILTDEKHHPKQAMRIAAYWRRGETNYHEELTPTRQTG